MSGVVEAIWWTGHNAEACLELGGPLVEKTDQRAFLLLHSPAGELWVPRRTWIIKDDAGRVFPCSERTFEKLYEEQRIRGEVGDQSAGGWNSGGMLLVFLVGWGLEVWVAEEIADLLEQLSPNVQLAFLMLALGRTQAEVARQLRVNQSTVSRWVSRDLQAVRRRLLARIGGKAHKAADFRKQHAGRPPNYNPTDQRLGWMPRQNGEFLVGYQFRGRGRA